MNNSYQLNIENITLQLPATYGQRADMIAREVVQRLSKLPFNNSASIKSIEVPVIRITGKESNQILAKTIATGIHKQILSTQRRGNHAD